VGVVFPVCDLVLLIGVWEREFPFWLSKYDTIDITLELIITLESLLFIFASVEILVKG